MSNITPYDSVFTPLHKIEIICDAIQKSTSIEELLTSFESEISSDKSLISVHDITVKSEDCLLPTSNLSRNVLKLTDFHDQSSYQFSLHINRLGNQLNSLCRNCPIGTPAIGGYIKSIVENVFEIIKDFREVSSKIQHIEDEKWKIEETALILVDRIKYERHNSESKYSDLHAKLHGNSELAEIYGKELNDKTEQLKAMEEKYNNCSLELSRCQDELHVLRETNESQHEEMKHLHESNVSLQLQLDAIHSDNIKLLEFREAFASTQTIHTRSKAEDDVEALCEIDNITTAIASHYGNGGMADINKITPVLQTNKTASPSPQQKTKQRKRKHQSKLSPIPIPQPLKLDLPTSTQIETKSRILDSTSSSSILLPPPVPDNSKYLQVVAEKNDLESKIRELQFQYDDIKIQLARQLQATLSSESYKEQLTTQLTDAQEDIREAVEKYRKIEYERDLLHSENIRLQDLSIEISSELSQLNDQLSIKDIEIETLSQQLQEASSYLLEYQQQLQQLQEQQWLQQEQEQQWQQEQQWLQQPQEQEQELLQQPQEQEQELLQQQQQQEQELLQQQQQQEQEFLQQQQEQQQEQEQDLLQQQQQVVVEEEVYSPTDHEQTVDDNNDPIIGSVEANGTTGSIVTTTTTTTSYQIENLKLREQCIVMEQKIQSLQSELLESVKEKSLLSYRYNEIETQLMDLQKQNKYDFEVLNLNFEREKFEWESNHTLALGTLNNQTKELNDTMQLERHQFQTSKSELEEQYQKSLRILQDQLRIMVPKADYIQLSQSSQTLAQQCSMFEQMLTDNLDENFALKQRIHSLTESKKYREEYYKMSEEETRMKWINSFEKYAQLLEKDYYEYYQTSKVQIESSLNSKIEEYALQKQNLSEQVVTLESLVEQHTSTILNLEGRCSSEEVINKDLHQKVEAYQMQIEDLYSQFMIVLEKEKHMSSHNLMLIEEEYCGQLSTISEQLMQQKKLFALESNRWSKERIDLEASQIEQLKILQDQIGDMVPKADYIQLSQSSQTLTQQCSMLEQMLSDNLEESLALKQSIHSLTETRKYREEYYKMSEEETRMRWINSFEKYSQLMESELIVQKTSFIAQVSELEARIVSNLKEQDNMEKEIEDYKLQLMELQQTSLTTLENERRRWNDEKSALETSHNGEINTLNEEILRHENLLNEKENDIKCKDDIINQNIVEKTELLATLSNSQVKVDDLQLYCDQLKAEVKMLESVIEELKEEIKAAVSDSDRMETERNQLRIDFQAWQQQLSCMSIELEIALKDRVTYQLALTECKVELESLVEERDKLKEALGYVQDERDTMKTDINICKTVESAMIIELQEAALERDNALTETQNVNKEKVVLQNKVFELTHELELKQGMISILENKIQELETTVNNLNIENQNTKSEINVAQQEKEALSQKHTEEISMIKTDKIKLESDLMGLQSERDNMMDNLQEIKMKLEMSQQDLLNVQSEREVCKSSLIKIHVEVDELTTKYKLVVTHRDSLIQEIQRLNEHMIKMEDSHQKLISTTLTNQDQSITNLTLSSNTMISNLTEQLKSSQLEVVNIQGNLTACKTERDDLRRALSHMESVATMEEESRQEYQKKFLALEKTLTQRISDFECLEKEVVAKREALLSSESAYSKLAIELHASLQKLEVSETKVAALQQELNQLQSKNSYKTDYETQIIELTKSIELLRSEMIDNEMEAKRTFSILSAEKDELEERLSLKSVEVHSLMEAFTTDNNNLKNQLHITSEESSHKISGLLIENQELQGQIQSQSEESKKTIATLIDESEKLQEELYQSKQLIESLKMELETVTNQFLQITEESQHTITAMTTERIELNDRIEELGIDIEAYRQQLGEVEEASRRKADEDLEKWTSAIATIEESYAQDMTDARDKLFESNELVEKLQEELKFTLNNQRIGSSSGSNIKNSSQINNNNKDGEEEEEDVEDDVRVLEEEKELNKVVAELEAAYSTEIANLRTRLQEEGIEYSEMKSRCETKEQELAVIQELMVALEERCQDMEEEKTELEQEIIRLNESLESALQTNNKLRNHSDVLELELQEMKSQELMNKSPSNQKKWTSKDEKERSQFQEEDHRFILELHEQLQNKEKIIDNLEAMLKQEKLAKEALDARVTELTIQLQSYTKNNVLEKLQTYSQLQSHSIDGTVTGSRSFSHRSKSVAASVEPMITTSSSSLSVSFPSYGNITSSKELPKLFVEIGGYEVRIGIWNDVKKSLDACFICPSMTASPRPGHNLNERLLGTILQSDKVLTLYREERVFIGRDAFYCAFNHPDVSIRSALELFYPLKDGHIVDADGFALLMSHALSNAMEVSGNLDLSSMQIYHTLKPTLSKKDLLSVADALFGRSLCDRVCLLNESCLSLVGAGIESAIVFHIGSSSSSAVPVYEGIVMDKAIQLTTVGGEHITELLCKILERHGTDELHAFNSQLSRRRLQIARQLKEDFAFVAFDFNRSAEQYGREELASVRESLLLGAFGDTADTTTDDHHLPVTAAFEISPTSKQRVNIKRQEELILSDGSVLSICLECERFYCTEVLFSPIALSSCHGTAGIVEMIVDAATAVDSSVREEVCSNILLTGRSVLLPGLIGRLERDLEEPMAQLGVRKINFIIGEERGMAIPSAAWRGMQKYFQNNSTSSNIEPNHNVNNIFLQENTITIEDYAEHGPSIIFSNK